jgi:predicted adenylyl cyclase CyaB
MARSFPVSRNIEIKARVADPGALAAQVARLATEGPVVIRQDDTFFHCSVGRLKLRTFSATEGELIHYQRADRLGPKESFHIRSPTQSPQSLREALTLALGQVGRVVKERTLFLVGRTRVHLDAVQGLGSFVELEVVLEEGEASEGAVLEAHTLMSRLGIDPQHLVEVAYVDLLANNGAQVRLPEA